eukprot:6209496-Pleurochrysis_carterae.AAC.1
MGGAGGEGGQTSRVRLGLGSETGKVLCRNGLIKLPRRSEKSGSSTQRLREREPKDQHNGLPASQSRTARIKRERRLQSARDSLVSTCVCACVRVVRVRCM